MGLPVKHASAQYQQEPIPLAGNIINQLCIVSGVPLVLSVYSCGHGHTARYRNRVYVKIAFTHAVVSVPHSRTQRR